MSFKNQVRVAAPFLAILLLILITPPKVFNQVAFFYSPQTSILGEDKTGPSSVKYTSDIPTEIKNNHVMVSGNAEAESTVNLYVNNELVKSLQSGKTSKFSFDFTLKEKENIFWTVVVDRNGNIGEMSDKNPIKWINAS